ncbi:esterase/lipase family protein [Glutamicibacter creatinolyticus]|uniref:esterase/lipase family protein n=1 Tax=Glutamicibacter creatinolyticus TaxID=162496 RepID=UPI0033EA3D7A
MARLLDRLHGALTRHVPLQLPACLHRIRERGVGQLRRGQGWLLDYLYAGYWQARAFLRPVAEQELLSYSDAQAAPVLLIPGIWETWQFLLPVARHLHQAGHPVHAVSGIGYNRGTVPQMSRLVSDYLAEHDLNGVVIVAHSKGGLIGKHAMSASPHSERIAKMVAISTPFSGSVYARFAPIRSLRAFSPRNAGLLQLAANLAVNSRITSIYSSFDPHIPGGSQLQGSQNIKLETMGHFRLLNDPRLLEAVREQVAAPVPEETYLGVERPEQPE